MWMIYIYINKYDIYIYNFLENGALRKWKTVASISLLVSKY